MFNCVAQTKQVSGNIITKSILNRVKYESVVLRYWNIKRTLDPSVCWTSNSVAFSFCFIHVYVSWVDRRAYSKKALENNFLYTIYFLFTNACTLVCTLQLVAWNPWELQQNSC